MKNIGKCKLDSIIGDIVKNDINLSQITIPLLIQAFLYDDVLSDTRVLVK